MLIYGSICISLITTEEVSLRNTNSQAKQNTTLTGRNPVHYSKSNRFECFPDLLINRNNTHTTIVHVVMITKLPHDFTMCDTGNTIIRRSILAKSC